MKTIKKNDQILLDELSAFAENVNAKIFSKCLRDFLLDYLQTEAGKNEELEDFLVNLQRLYILLDTIEEYQS